MMNLDFNQNFFELFGLEPAYQIDTIRLEQAFRDIQARVHPDKFAHAGDAERRLSMQWATRANEGYQTLRQPLERARYLLHLNGIELNEETNTAMAPAFLMQQMEWREAIGEAKAASDIPELEHLSAKLRAEISAQQSRLSALLDGEKHFQQAAEAVRELKFMEKLREEINYALESLEE